MMTQSATLSRSEDAAPAIVAAGFAMKVFYVFAALALASGGISLAGKFLGSSIAMVGHTTDTRPLEIVVGNNVLMAPANMVRFESARRHGEAPRLDLYAIWPGMNGYSDGDRDVFNNNGAQRRIIFMSVEQRQMSRDMSGRLEPIYRRLIELPGSQGPEGLRRYGFSAGSGYVNEVLMVGQEPGREPFVARCLTGPAADESLAGCERDIHFGDGLSLTYRFPEELLDNWMSLEAAVRAKLAEMLKG